MTGKTGVDDRWTTGDCIVGTLESPDLCIVTMMEDYQPHPG